jgi:hypothetical protein
VLNRIVFAGTLALASAGVVAAQSTATTQDPNRPQTGTQQQPSTSAQQQTVTLTGCVYKEKDVPGRSPNVAEQAGVLEDYILANVEKKDSASQAPAATGQTTPQTNPSATGTSGMMHSMFKLEHADDSKLSALVGKRVEVMGRIDAERGDTRQGAAAGTTGTQTGTQTGAQQPQRDRSLGPDQIELPEFEVTSIREVAGACPAKPEAPHKR